MDVLNTLTRVLGVPLIRLRYWDTTEGVIVKGAMTMPGDTLLATHAIPAGYVAVLTGWSQYIFSNQEAPCPCDYEMPSFNAEQAWWRINVGPYPPADLDRIYEVRNSWNGFAGRPFPCFYLTDPEPSPTTIEMYWAGLAHPFGGDYEVAGRLMGFDFPSEYLQKQSLLGDGTEEGDA